MRHDDTNKVQAPNNTTRDHTTSHDGRQCITFFADLPRGAHPEIDSPVVAVTTTVTSTRTHASTPAVTASTYLPEVTRSYKRLHEFEVPQSGMAPQHH